MANVAHVIPFVFRNDFVVLCVFVIVVIITVGVGVGVVVAAVVIISVIQTISKIFA